MVGNKKHVLSNQIKIILDVYGDYHGFLKNCIKIEQNYFWFDHLDDEVSVFNEYLFDEYLRIMTSVS